MKNIFYLPEGNSILNEFNQVIMVRLNKQVDFHFPFLSSNSSPTPNHLDLIDSILSIFAAAFFFVALLAITLDNTNPRSYISTNSATKLKPQVVVDIISLTKLEEEKSQISKNNILVLAPSKKVTTPKSNHPKAIEISTSNINQQYTSKVVAKDPQEKIPLNQPKTTKISSDVNITTTTKTLKVSPKPVFVDSKNDIDELVINNKITQDLLPLSYLHAKEKAVQEDKLMYIKFGAKWCLPCRQMEKTTFNNERVKNFSDKNYVSFAVDVDDFDGVNMKAYFNVQFLPTLLIFNAQGNFIAKYVNYQSAASLLEILKKHKSEQQVLPAVASNEVIVPPAIEVSKAKKITSIDFNKIILSKKKNGNAINSLKSKAKNWRFTELDFSTKNIHTGELLLKIKENISGLNLTELNLPMNNNQGFADTTTTNFQLVLEHEKRKKKDGEYVIEIYHLTQNDSKLVGKTTLLKDGEIHF